MSDVDAATVRESWGRMTDVQRVGWRRVDAAPDLTGDALRAWSNEWEDETGADSIATVERVYETSASGAYLCVWPGCPYHRDDAEAIWRHVHFTCAKARAWRKEHPA